eukprot:s1196_g9.t1
MLSALPGPDGHIASSELIPISRAQKTVGWAGPSSVSEPGCGLSRALEEITVTIVTAPSSSSIEISKAEIVSTPLLPDLYSAYIREFYKTCQNPASAHMFRTHVENVSVYVPQAQASKVHGAHHPSEILT